MIATAQAELGERIHKLLLRENLLAAESTVESFSTPRRLAVKVGSISSQQPDVKELLTGPPSSIAFKNGEPTPAGHAFAKKAGVEVSVLTRTTSAKGEYVTANVLRKGQSATDVLKAQLPKELAALYWPKNMYWRAGKPERFVRPLRWLLALLDDQVVDVEFAGTAASSKTYGHRVLQGDQPIEIGHPSEYLPKLEAAFVIADVEARRHKIRKGLDAAARTVTGIRWREDHPLVDAVTHLTEWPSVLLGSFEAEYLTLPEEVLVTVMRDHQKYFALEDASGKLAPYFLAVLNTEADEAGLAVIRHGNERVLRSRFKDARFFWDFDQKIPLVDRVEMLKSVTFQKDLGSYYDRFEVNRRIGATLVTELAYHVHISGGQVDVKSLREAVNDSIYFSKADLTTELVKEFTELQGVIGGLYARAQGLGENVAQAVYWQYRPASTDDLIPSSVDGQLLGIADRIGTIVDMFAIGLEPTGSKDPFALRRAGNGVVKILADANLPLTISQVAAIGTNESAFGARARTPLETEQIVKAVRNFLRERLEFYLREARGFAYDVVAATLTAGEDDIPDAIARAQALTAVRGSKDFAAISAAFKRIKNILRQAAEKEKTSPEDIASTVDEALLTEPAEKALWTESTRLSAVVETLRDERKYREALEKIATLRPHVDGFFDAVMVMAPEPEIRKNRLALIASVLAGFSKIADFSEIVTS